MDRLKYQIKGVESKRYHSGIECYLTAKFDNYKVVRLSKVRLTFLNTLRRFAVWNAFHYNIQLIF